VRNTVKKVLIQVVPLLALFFTEFLSVYRKERKVFLSLVNALNEQGTREKTGIYR